MAEGSAWIDHKLMQLFACLCPAGMRYDPTGEGLPRGSFAHGYPYLLHEDEETSRPERNAINLARGPHVVGHQAQQKDVGEQRSPVRNSVDKGEGQAVDGGDQDRCWPKRAPTKQA